MIKRELMQDLRRRSGEVNGSVALISFLYEILRDCIQPGDLEPIVQGIEGEGLGANVHYSNGWLALYAEDVAKRLAPSLFESEATPQSQVKTLQDRDKIKALLEQHLRADDPKDNQGGEKYATVWGALNGNESERCWAIGALADAILELL